MAPGGGGRRALVFLLPGRPRVGEARSAPARAPASPRWPSGCPGPSRSTLRSPSILVPGAFLCVSAGLAVVGGRAAGTLLLGLVGGVRAARRRWSPDPGRGRMASPRRAPAERGASSRCRSSFEGLSRGRPSATMAIRPWRCAPISWRASARCHGVGRRAGVLGDRRRGTPGPARGGAASGRFGARRRAAPSAGPPRLGAAAPPGLPTFRETCRCRRRPRCSRRRPPCSPASSPPTAVSTPAAPASLIALSVAAGSGCASCRGAEGGRGGGEGTGAVVASRAVPGLRAAWSGRSRAGSGSARRGRGKAFGATGGRDPAHGSCGSARDGAGPGRRNGREEAAHADAPSRARPRHGRIRPGAPPPEAGGEHARPAGAGLDPPGAGGGLGRRGFVALG